MIYFPKHFTPLPKYPGYYWHLEEKKLYSIKVAGILKPMKPRKLHPAALRYSFGKSLLGGIKTGDTYYQISVDGVPKYISFYELNKLVLEDHEIPKRSN